MRRLLALVGLLAACASGPPAPAMLDTKNESCAWCRMAISQTLFAGQLVSPSEEPRFFDDIGCLGHFVQASKALPSGTIAYVVDHRTRRWVRAGVAIYTSVTSLATPMDSHLVAHVDSASRDADPTTKGGSPRTLAEVFGPGGPPGGGP